MPDILTTESRPPDSVGERRWQPPTAAQWIAVTVTLLVSGLLALGLPWLARSTAPEDRVLEAGASAAAGGVSVEPAEGWLWDSDVEGIVKLVHGDSSLLVFPAGPATASPEKSLEESVELFRSDTTTSYDIGEPQSFTTASGMAGLSIVVLSPERASVLFVLSDGTTQIQAQFNGSYATWTDVSDEVRQIMTTVELTDGGAA